MAVTRKLLTTFVMSEQERDTRQFNMPGLGDTKPLPPITGEALSLQQCNAPRLSLGVPVYKLPTESSAPRFYREEGIDRPPCTG